VQEPATKLEAKRLAVGAKFQASNYPYSDRSAFHADSSIQASVGLAGLPYPSTEFDSVPGQARAHP